VRRSGARLSEREWTHSVQGSIVQSRIGGGRLDALLPKEARGSGHGPTRARVTAPGRLWVRSSPPSAAPTSSPPSVATTGSTTTTLGASVQTTSTTLLFPHQPSFMQQLSGDGYRMGIVFKDQEGGTRSLRCGSGSIPTMRTERPTTPSSTTQSPWPERTEPQTPRKAG
jgi:hypothetical protein